MSFLNAIFRLFGYEWVKDETPYQRDDDPRTDEGWDDLYEHSPRYKLRKIKPDRK
ncbi:hypothetical protein [Thiomicrorhabdus sp. 6S3-12]|uniref:hypothetical protein n=1 Tax=Thiomicrorhabdus sp. 6S3-12 TaxID=2819681 RepID=UPI001AAC985E|nr:hypothetical protein [Thiomicrorhabdus sp. 6S3-12]MBO1924714.1 hypothetical protein [Thiomicrorhabdus sp. 6S3-12]